MNDKLIHDLVRDLTPVARLASPLRRSLYFALASAPVTLLLAAHSGLRADLGAKLVDPTFAFETLSLLTLFAGAALAALTSAIPGLSAKPALRLMAGGAGAWLFLIACLAVTGVGSSPIAFARLSEPAFLASGFACLCRSLLLATLPMLILVSMVRRARAAHATVARLTGALVFVCAGTLAVLGTRLVCAKDDAQHVLTWHAMPLVILALAGWILGTSLVERERLATRLTRVVGKQLPRRKSSSECASKR